VDVVVGLSVLHWHIQGAITHNSLSSSHILLDKTTARVKLCGFGHSLYHNSPDGEEEREKMVEEVEERKAKDLYGLGVMLVEVARMAPINVLVGAGGFGGRSVVPKNLVSLLPDDCPMHWITVVDMCSGPEADTKN